MREEGSAAHQGRASKAVNLGKPRWGPEGEQPVLVREFDDGSLRWYGTGTAVADVAEVPITVRLPYLWVRGKVVWGVPRTNREELTMALRKILKEAKGPEGAGPGAADKGTWPTLLEYLTETKYPDGSAREVSCLVITADATGWRGCVSDKDNSRTMWKTAETVEGLLLALELGLMADEPSDWRQSAAAKWKGKKRG